MDYNEGTTTTIHHELHVPKASADEDKLEVEVALSNLKNAVERNGRIVRILHARLRSVISEEITVEDVNPVPFKCDLASRLSELTSQVYQCNGEIEVILRALQL